MAKSSLSAKINRLFEQEEWPAARKLLRTELEKTPEDHWLLTRLSTTYYEEKNYRKALEYVEHARELAPNCPLVLWDYAGTLDMLGRYKEAARCYVQLLRKGPRNIASDECGEGLAWARSLLADCVYRLGICQLHLGHPQTAARLLRKYFEARIQGVSGIYSLDDVQRQLAKIQHKPRTVGTLSDELIDEALQEV